jgi:hypothetical protein
MSTAVPVPVEKVVLSPIVSYDSNSKESQLMRQIKQVEAQSIVDTKFDTVLERFEPSKMPLVTFAVAILAYVSVVILLSRKK